MRFANICMANTYDCTYTYAIKKCVSPSSTLMSKLLRNGTMIVHACAPTPFSSMTNTILDFRVNVMCEKKDRKCSINKSFPPAKIYCGYSIVLGFYSATSSR